MRGTSLYGPIVLKLNVFTTDQDGKDREVIVLFLNLKGYDGMFLLQYCYDNQLEVKDQITVGTKITI